MCVLLLLLQILKRARKRQINKEFDSIYIEMKQIAFILEYPESVLILSTHYTLMWRWAHPYVSRVPFVLYRCAAFFIPVLLSFSFEDCVGRMYWTAATSVGRTAPAILVYICMILLHSIFLYMPPFLCVCACVIYCRSLNPTQKTSLSILSDRIQSENI